jgi:hypothetical protein
MSVKISERLWAYSSRVRAESKRVSMVIMGVKRVREGPNALRQELRPKANLGGTRSVCFLA